MQSFSIRASHFFCTSLRFLLPFSIRSRSIASINTTFLLKISRGQPLFAAASYLKMSNVVWGSTTRQESPFFSAENRVEMVKSCPSTPGSMLYSTQLPLGMPPPSISSIPLIPVDIMG